MPFLAGAVILSAIIGGVVSAENSSAQQGAADQAAGQIANEKIKSTFAESSARAQRLSLLNPTKTPSKKNTGFLGAELEGFPKNERNTPSVLGGLGTSGSGASTGTAGTF